MGDEASIHSQISTFFELPVTQCKGVQQVPTRGRLVVIAVLHAG